MMVCEDIEFGVRLGEFFLIVGFSGCGKTMLLRIVGGLIRVIGGGVVIGDELVDGFGFDCGFVFQ